MKCHFIFTFIFLLPNDVFAVYVHICICVYMYVYKYIHIYLMIIKNKNKWNWMLVFPFVFVISVGPVLVLTADRTFCLWLNSEIELWLWEKKQKQQQIIKKESAALWAPSVPLSLYVSLSGSPALGSESAERRFLLNVKPLESSRLWLCQCRGGRNTAQQQGSNGKLPLLSDRFHIIVV